MAESDRKPSDDRVLIAGLSTRAMAASATRAGFEVVSIDAFGDLDNPGVYVELIPGYTARRAAVLSRSFSCHAVAYTANFENHPEAVERLSARRELLGNPPSVLRRVRNPLELARVLEEKNLPTPQVRASGSTPETGARWLIKPLASGGGLGIRDWHPGQEIPVRAYLQEYIDGIPGSAVFVAAPEGAVLLGFSRQLIGDPEFGASGFQYCGNILTSGDRRGDELWLSNLKELVTLLSHHFGLVGVNSIDFIEVEGRPYVVEVNPRWSASMELAERSYRLSIFGVHVEACREGVLPAFDIRQATTSLLSVGKAVIYARHGVTLRDTRPWLGDPSVRDIPRPGQSIAAGRPVCTVFAESADSSSCYENLVRRAKQLYAALDSSDFVDTVT